MTVSSLDNLIFGLIVFVGGYGDGVLIALVVVSLLYFVHIHSGVLTGGGDLSSLGGKLMVDWWAYWI